MGMGSTVVPTRKTDFPANMGRKPRKVKFLPFAKNNQGVAENRHQSSAIEGKTQNMETKEIELYVHTDAHHEPKLVKINPEANVEEFLAAIAPGSHHEFHLFVEDEEEPKDRNHRLCDCHVHHRKHVHCHRCRHVHVGVTFNGDERKHEFVPSTTIARVLKWALKEFRLTGQDAARKVLRLTPQPNDPLAEDAHIGSFAKAPKCDVELSLTDDVNVNG